MATLYSVLGLPPAATLEELHASYRALARSNHPDAGGDHATFCAVTEAWSVLGDPVRRRAYEAELRLTRQACHACKGEGRVYKSVGFTERASRPCPVCDGEGYQPVGDAR